MPRCRSLSVHLLVQALQPDAQANGKSMAGLAARKGKGKGVQLEKEIVFDQVAVEQCVNKIKHLRAMLESATLLRNQVLRGTGWRYAPMVAGSGKVGVGTGDSQERSGALFAGFRAYGRG